MSKVCPICKQPLPKGVSNETINSRIHKLSAKETKIEVNKIRRSLLCDYKKQLVDRLAEARKAAARETEARFLKQISSLRQELKESERQARRKAEEAKKDVRVQSRQEIMLIKSQMEMQNVQHEKEKAGLKNKINDLARKVESQTIDQRGEMTESDVFAALKDAFPNDDIERVRKGVPGADIVHKIMVNGKEVGRIVYECKNVATWQNE